MKILDSKIELPKIAVEIGENTELPEAEAIVNSYGTFKPILSINDNLINTGDIISIDYFVEYNKLPIINITLDDSYNRIRNMFTDIDLIKGLIFIGNKHWYHKFEFVVLDTDINEYDNSITLFCIMYIPKIYNNNQISFNNKSLKDIMEELCTELDLGLVLDESNSITEPLKNVFNSNRKYIDTIQQLIEKYSSNCLWCIDNNYMLHINTYDTLIQKELDTYTINYRKKYDSPKPVIITNYPKPDNDYDFETNEDQYKLVANDVIIHNNTGVTSLLSFNEYGLNDTNVNSNSELGTGKTIGNTFSKWTEEVKPFYNDIFLKEIAGNTFELVMQQPLLEIFPFMIIETEIYNKNPDKVTEVVLNEKQSGKHIVVGYQFSYNKPTTNKLTFIEQRITLI